MTDCKGAFAFGYEVDTAGAIAAFSQYAGAKPKDKKKPSAGMTGGTAGGKRLNVVGIGCGDETPALALKETRRLMNQLRADVIDCRASYVGQRRVDGNVGGGDELRCPDGHGQCHGRHQPGGQLCRRGLQHATNRQRDTCNAEWHRRRASRLQRDRY